MFKQLMLGRFMSPKRPVNPAWYGGIYWEATLEQDYVVIYGEQ